MFRGEKQSIREAQNECRKVQAGAVSAFGLNLVRSFVRFNLGMVV